MVCDVALKHKQCPSRGLANRVALCDGTSGLSGSPVTICSQEPDSESCLGGSWRLICNDHLLCVAYFASHKLDLNQDFLLKRDSSSPSLEVRV
jgi:hypothetical protein